MTLAVPDAFTGFSTSTRAAFMGLVETAWLSRHSQASAML
jgi:hypothetical protein